MGENMADERVLDTQKWLNKTYGDVSGFQKVPETGITGWDTIYGLIEGAQHEMGITGLVKNWGPSSQKMWSEKFSKKIKSGYKHNVVKILQGAFWAKGINPGSFSGEVDSSLLGAIKTLKTKANVPEINETPDSYFMSALLSMKQFQLVSGGDINVQQIQQSLNNEYYDYLIHDDNGIGILATDGIYQRDTSTAIIYAVQDTIGLSKIANGVLGPTTLRTLPDYFPIASGHTNSLVKIANWGLYLNGFNQNANFVSTLDINAITQLQEFAKFMAIDGSSELTFGIFMSLIASNGDTDRASIAVDTSEQLNSTKANTLKEYGYSIVGRYLSGTVGSGAAERPKNLTDSELVDLFNAGLDVFPIFQEGNPTTASYFTSSQGHQDAVKAWHAADSLGFNPGTVIYFAVDGDILGGDITGSVVPYFEAVSKVMTSAGYVVGIYATRNVAQNVISSGYAQYAFVSNMSYGYSGNMGFKMPNNWAFDQFTETSVGLDNIAIDKVGTTKKRSTAVSSVNTNGNNFQLLAAAKNILSVFPLTSNVEVSAEWKDNEISGNAGPFYIKLSAEAGLKFTGKNYAKFEVDGQQIDLNDVVDKIKGAVKELGLSQTQQIVDQLNDLAKKMGSGTIYYAIAPADAHAGGRYGLQIVTESKYEKTVEKDNKVVTVSEDMTVSLSVYFRDDPKTFKLDESKFTAAQSNMGKILSGALSVEKYEAQLIGSLFGYLDSALSKFSIKDGLLVAAEVTTTAFLVYILIMAIPLGA